VPLMAAVANAMKPGVLALTRGPADQYEHPVS
jgi:hypothetical protein